MSKMYLKQNVFDAALDRIRFIFDEFENVAVSFSGGKDSTATLNMALIVAEEKGRLPLPVLFLDQEAEWQNVIDYVETVMEDDRVTPMWFQMPIRLTNATSNIEHYLNCWQEGGQWMRDKVPYAITENIYGTDRFHALFPAIYKHHWDGPLAVLAGVRGEESPARMSGLTTGATYKWVTWGKKMNKDQYNFYPLYDWSYTDIWKAIHDNDWSYAKAYDYFYQYGVPASKMRISNLHHETAIHQLFYLQEIERETWNKLTDRLGGINQARHLSKQDMFQAKDLPFMFDSWKEYRDHLLVNLITDTEYQEKMRARFERMDDVYGLIRNIDKMHRVHVATILANDVDFTKCDNFEQQPYAITFRRWRRGEPKDIEFIKRSNCLDWIPEEYINVG